MIAWWRPLILTASCCDLTAGAVTAWWALPGYVVGVLFALFFLAAGALLMVAGFKGSLRLLVAGLVLTVIGVLEPAGGVLASVTLHQSPGLGAVLPLVAGALSIVGTVTVLLRDRSGPGARYS